MTGCCTTHAFMNSVRAEKHKCAFQLGERRKGVQVVDLKGENIDLRTARPEVKNRVTQFIQESTAGNESRGQKTEPRGGQGAFRGRDRYDFAIVLPASRQDCFWHFAHQSGRFYLTYMVQWVTGVANNRRLSTTVSSPRGFLLAIADDATGHFNFQTEETGFYQMCFSNVHNTFGNMRVFLNFGVYYEGFEEARENEERENQRLNDTLSSIQKSVNTLQGHIIHMWRHYSFARMRRGADQHLLLSNHRYVTWWSAAQTALIVAVGYLQLLFLKKLFRADAAKHRC